MNWKWNVSTLFRELKFSLLNDFMQWLVFNIIFTADEYIKCNMIVCFSLESLDSYKLLWSKQ